MLLAVFRRLITGGINHSSIGGGAGHQHTAYLRVQKTILGGGLSSSAPLLVGLIPFLFGLVALFAGLLLLAFGFVLQVLRLLFEALRLLAVALILLGLALRLLFGALGGLLILLRLFQGLLFFALCLLWRRVNSLDAFAGYRSGYRSGDG